MPTFANQTQKTAILPFSIANFRKVFNNSPSLKYMSDMEIEQVRKAIEDKDVMLLGKLYDILLRERTTDEQIIRDFVMTKNRIIDNFLIETTTIEKKMIEAPMREKIATAEQKEQMTAEDILNNLNN